MKIEILGMGCPKCEKLYENVQVAVGQKNIDAEIVKVTNLNDIANYRIMVTPALVIDGIVKTVGKMPSAEEIKKWL